MESNAMEWQRLAATLAALALLAVSWLPVCYVIGKVIGWFYPNF